MSVTGLAYLVLYFGGMMMALFGRPLIGLYTYVFTFYMYAPGRWWGAALPDLRWSLLAAVVTLFALVISKKRDQSWVVSTEVKLFTGYVAWVWIQSSWAMASQAHGDYVIMVTKFLVLMFLVQNAIRDQKGLNFGLTDNLSL